MVITDIDTQYLSREASGRFQVTLATRPAGALHHPAEQKPIDLQSARNQVQAITAARHVLRTLHR